MINNYYKLIIKYDGTNYQGWQEQKNASTVAGTLKNAFKAVFKKEISMVGASRTDAGVHSKCQVARIRTTLNMSSSRLKSVWNRSLPEDILIYKLQKISTDFHPQKNVEQKTYIYKIFEKKPSPFIARYGYFFDYDLDIGKLKEALKVFVGKHDFRSFCTGYEMDSTIRKIDSISLKKNKEEASVEIIIKGKSFLRYMIRRIVGACLEAASRERLSEKDLKRALGEKSPYQKLPTAPAKGLILEKIQYYK